MPKLIPHSPEAPEKLEKRCPNTHPVAPWPWGGQKNDTQEPFCHYNEQICDGEKGKMEYVVKRTAKWFMHSGERWDWQLYSAEEQADMRSLGNH